MKISNRIRQLFLCIAAIPGLLLFVEAAFGEQPPNVILIVTDDQGYGDMSCHGNPWLQTPNLDRLASRSVSFADYHVDPVCTPTRAALLTGRYSLRTGAWHVVQGRQLLRRDEVTLADVFRASGYSTAMFGKWHLGDNYPYAPRYRGFEHVVCHKAGGVDEIGNPHENDYIDDTYFRNGKPEVFKGYCTDVWFQELEKYIARNRESESSKPFFAYVATNAMHSPFTVDEKYSAPYSEKGVPKDRAVFYGMIANFDENLGRLMTRLDELKIADDTILIFMGDNGTAAGAAGTYGATVGFNSGMRGWKGSMYEGGHRVACFASWPGKFAAGRVVDHLTAHLDWFPTLVELCQLKTSKRLKLDGHSLVPFLKGAAKVGSGDRTIFVERQRDKLVQHDAASKKGQIAVLTERWRLVKGELYDIEADRGQTKDLAKQFPDVVSDLARQHADWFEDVTNHKGDYSRFIVGDQGENPTTMTVRDWHPTQGHVIWKQPQLGDDALFINGFWALDVARVGKYKIRLSRFPDDNLAAMKVASAKIKIGSQQFQKECAATDRSITFEVELKQGPTELRTWLTDEKTGSSRGAYFVTFVHDDKP